MKKLLFSVDSEKALKGYNDTINRHIKHELKAKEIDFEICKFFVNAKFNSDFYLVEDDEYNFDQIKDMILYYGINELLQINKTNVSLITFIHDSIQTEFVGKIKKIKKENTLDNPTYLFNTLTKEYFIINKE